MFGVMQSIPSSTLTEIACWCGYDFVILDCETGVVDEVAQLASLQVVSGGAAFSAVRVRAGDLSAVGRYLNRGADAILLPDVTTGEQAAAFVAAATCGPRGTRSSARGARVARHGMMGKSEENRTRPLLLAMMEGASAVRNAVDIAATPGLDGVVIGPNDLSADLGCPGDFASSAYSEAFMQIERAARGVGMILGSALHAGFGAERLLRAGHRFILAGSDVAVLREGFRTNLAVAWRS